MNRQHAAVFLFSIRKPAWYPLLRCSSRKYAQLRTVDWQYQRARLYCHITRNSCRIFRSPVSLTNLCQKYSKSSWSPIYKLHQSPDPRCKGREQPTCNLLYEKVETRKQGYECTDLSHLGEQENGIFVQNRSCCRSNFCVSYHNRQKPLSSVSVYSPVVQTLSQC